MPGPALDLDLDAFEGPFDLLLTLILKEELRLAEVEVAEIVTSFAERLVEQDRAPVAGASLAREASERREDSTEGYGLAARAQDPSASGARPASPGFAGGDPAGERRERLDLEACGEFLVLVGAMLEIKARELFPEAASGFDDLSPEEAAEELAERLEAYRRMKSAAASLSERLDAEADRYFRLGPAPLAPKAELRVAPQHPETLAAALRVLAQEPSQVSLAHMQLTFPPVARFLERLRAVLRRRRRFAFDDEVGGLSRLEQASAFLALLELRKLDELRIEQRQPFGPIGVSRRGVERSAA